MTTARRDPFNALRTFTVHGREYGYYSLAALSQQKIGGPIEKMPYSIRVLLESMLRSVDGFVVTADDVAGMAGYDAKNVSKDEVPFMPGRTAQRPSMPPPIQLCSVWPASTE